MEITTGKLGKVQLAKGWVNSKPYGFIWNCYMCVDTLAINRRWATVLMAVTDLENHHRMRH